MKATELMLNDFLYYKNHGKVVRVSEIIGGLGECVKVSFNKKNNIRSNTPAVLGCNLHPIKITKEWLELNGFTEISYDRYARKIGELTIFIIKWSTSLELHVNTGKSQLLSYSFGTEPFIHLLQHYTNKYNIDWIMPNHEK